MSDVNIKVGLDSGGANRGLKELKGNLNGIGKAANNVSGNFLKLAAAAGGIAAAVKGLQAIGTTGASFEDLRSSLNAVFGSVEQGSAAFDRVKAFAKTTQFSVQQLTKNFVQLKAAGIEPTEDLLRTFADAASVTTDELGTFQASMDLLSRTTAGGLGLEELNRLADRGIPVFEILEEKLGLTRLEISKVGKTAEGAQQIIAALTEGLEQRFGGASLARAQNLNQILNNLGDSVDSLNDKLFQAGFGRFFKILAIGFGSFIEQIEAMVGGKGSLDTFFDTVAKGIFDLVGNILLGAAALADLFAPVFKMVGNGLNNIIDFLNMLPAELKALGIIGFMFLGGKGKLVFLAIVSAFDLVMGLINKIVQGTEGLINGAVDGINTLIETYNAIPGLPDIDLAEKVDFPEFTADDVKKGLADLSESLFGFEQISRGIFDKGLTGSVADALGASRKAVEEFLEKYGAELNNLGGGDSGGEDGAATGFIAGWKRASEELQTLLQDSAKFGEDIFKTMTNSFSDAILNFVETGKLSFKDLFKTLMTEIIKMQANKIFLSLFGAGGMFGDLFAGFFNKGGKIPAGKFGIAGESGPEIITGPANVTSTADTAMQLGRNREVVVNYNINAVDAQSFKQLVASDPEFIYNVTRVGQRRLPA